MGLKGQTDEAKGCSSPQQLEKVAKQTTFLVFIILFHPQIWTQQYEEDLTLFTVYFGFSSSQEWN